MSFIYIFFFLLAHGKFHIKFKRARHWKTLKFSMQKYHLNYQNADCKISKQNKLQSNDHLPNLLKEHDSPGVYRKEPDSYWPVQLQSVLHVRLTTSRKPSEFFISTYPQSLRCALMASSILVILSSFLLPKPFLTSLLNSSKLSSLYR